MDKEVSTVAQTAPTIVQPTFQSYEALGHAAAEGATPRRGPAPDGAVLGDGGPDESVRLTLDAVALRRAVDAAELTLAEQLADLADVAETEHLLGSDVHEAAEAEQVAAKAVVPTRRRAGHVTSRPSIAEECAWAVSSAMADVACRLGVSEAEVSGLARLYARLRSELAGTLEAWREGRLTRRHAEAIARATVELDPAELGPIEAALLRLADRGRTPAQLRREGTRLVAELRAETLQARHERARRERRLTLAPAEDGMAWLSALLPAPDACAAYNRTHDIAKRLHDHDAAESATAGRPATVVQLQADVFRDLLVDGVTESPSGCVTTGGVTEPGKTQPGEPRSPTARHDLARTSRGVRATVSVTVPASTLLGRSDAPGRIDGLCPIDAETARQLAGGDAAWMRILTDPAEGRPVDLGRRVYRPPSSLSRQIRARDETCRFPGCARSAAHCEIDHTIAWQHGGTTTFGNLATLCPRHHTMKHHTGWRVTQVHGHPGHLVWRSPSGYEQHTDPPPKPTSPAGDRAAPF